MVLQRDQPIRIFGWALPGAEVRVRLGNGQAVAKSARDGRWAASLAPFSAGGPYTLSVKSGRKQIHFRNILIGDLWFCSGQSNMSFQVSRTLTAKAAMKKARLPLIRHFQAERVSAEKPQGDVPGSWAVCDPKTVGEFTAVGFYFAREIGQQTGVPIGLIHSSWGGTPIEAWIPPQAYKASPALRPLLRMQNELRRPTKMLERLFKKWEKEYVSLDPGNRGEKRGWARPDFDDRKWKSDMKVPGYWEGQGLFIDGAVWFRRTVKIPKAWHGRELQLELGTIDDFDETYFNGIRVGQTGKSVANAYKVPRVYRVPAELVRAGKAYVAVRIFDQFGSGGFTGQKEMLRLSCPGLPRDKGIPLAAPAGTWRYRVEWSVERHSPRPQPPALPEPRAQLSQLYNGMVHAFTRLPIRGFLWYQGESNAFRAAHYQKSFPLMIQAWRKAWRKADLPFYFVQLANFNTRPSKPSEDFWAELREAQALALQVEKTGMVVAIDVGEEEDIHPRNKEEVGRRLALLALTRTYGKKVADSGPVLSEVRFKHGQAHLMFDEVGGGLRTSDGKAIRGFALAGRNRQWVWARARRVDKKALVVSSDKIQKPVAVRYGWASNPGNNLENSHGLPAAPFRTDEWPRQSEGNLWPF
jgi:sialate O-acetylesterase